MYRKFAKFLQFYVFRPFVLIYLKSEKKFYFDNLRLVILPGIYHPGIFPSTLFLYSEIKKINVKGRHVLDLGSGSGMLAIQCARKGALTVASDINWKSIINIDKNSRWNRVAISIIQSDLFVNIQKQKFDYIFIDPPRYRKNPQKDSDFTWFCGENLEFFSKFFTQIRSFLHPQSMVFMVIFQGSHEEKILRLATENNLKTNIHAIKTVFPEKMFLYKFCLQ